MNSYLGLNVSESPKNKRFVANMFVETPALSDHCSVVEWHDHWWHGAHVINILCQWIFDKNPCVRKHMRSGHMSKEEKLRQNMAHWPPRLPPLSSRTSIIGFLCLQWSFINHFWYHEMRLCISLINSKVFSFEDEYFFQGWSVIRLFGWVVGTWLDCGRCLLVGGENSPLGSHRLRAVEKK